MNRYGIDKTKHYFAQMDIIDMIIPFMGVTISSGKRSWVECKIIEDRYKVDEGYKVTLHPLDPRFSSHDFYQMDFNSLLKSGHIIEKTSDNQKVVYCEWDEPLTPTVNIKHSGYVVVG